MRPPAPLDEGARRAVATNDALRLHAARLSVERSGTTPPTGEAGDSTNESGGNDDSPTG